MATVVEDFAKTVDGKVPVDHENFQVPWLDIPTEGFTFPNLSVRSIDGVKRYYGDIQPSPVPGNSISLINEENHNADATRTLFTLNASASKVTFNYDVSRYVIAPVPDYLHVTFKDAKGQIIGTRDIPAGPPGAGSVSDECIFSEPGKQVGSIEFDKKGPGGGASVKHFVLVS